MSETPKTEQKELGKVRVSKIFLPVLIGLAVVGYLFWDEFDPNTFSLVSFTWKSVFWLFVALLFMIGRDFGYMLRIRILSENKLSWRQAFRVIMLWEFTSAITPSAIGGTSVAIIYVNKEGLSVGKSSAIVMATSLLDELYFVLMFPLLMLIIGPATLFSVEGSVVVQGIVISAIIGYSIKLVWTILLFYGMFKNPQGLNWLIQQVFRLPFLRRWKEGAAKAGHDIITNSNELKSKPFSFWLKAFGATFLSWTSRYWVVNAIFLAFFAVGDHFLLFGRQLIMWIAMLIMPTPGGSGFAEWAFGKFLGPFIPIAGLTIVLAFIWRLITYYPYLIAGALMFPKWLSDKFGKRKKTATEATITEN